MSELEKHTIVIQCLHPKHPTKVVAIDTFEWLTDQWSGESAWRGRYAQYSRDSHAVESHPSVRHVYLTDGLAPERHHVLRCRLCRTTARLNVKDLDQLLDTLVRRGDDSFPLSALASRQ